MNHRMDRVALDKLMRLDQRVGKYCPHKSLEADFAFDQFSKPGVLV